MIAKIDLFCGKVASGKSTLARHLSVSKQKLLVSEDQWLSTLYPDTITTLEDYTHYSKRVEKVIAPLLICILKSGTSIVLDFHANEGRRRDWLRDIVTESDAAH